MTELYRVKQTFVTWDRERVRAGKVVRAGHPVMKGREELFEPIVVDYELPHKADKTTEYKPSTKKSTAKKSTSKASTKKSE